MAIIPKLRKSSEPIIPERISAPTSIVDRSKLYASLIKIAGGSDDCRAQLLERLKLTRSKSMDYARKNFEMGRYGGLEMARVIAAIHDDIVTALYDFTLSHIHPPEDEAKQERMALCAVGGYGRGEMAPGSDLDLLFLLDNAKSSPHAESVTEYMLYMLWDMGLKVGHSVRTTEQNIKLAKSDQTILTALLDVRFLSGDEALAENLFAKFRKNVTRGKGREFIAAKLEERDIRHEREGNSRYVIEPNVKEGKGGLRDLHVLYWIARYLDKDGKILDAQNADDYVEMGLFDKASATRFMRAADFLWRTRIHLHFTSTRPSESLTFDKQTILARKMGHAAGPIEEAVEKFMREYFINAREVGALTRIACAKLEAEKSLRLPKGLDALLPNSRRTMREEGFILDHGRLMFEDPMQLRETPALIMELFDIAGRLNLDIHPDALSAINFRQNLIDNNFRRDPKIAEIFLNILLKSKAPYATLKVMSEAGVLGRYVLEFGAIIARTQFNMHHAYTVDEHTMRLIKYLHDIEVGALETENPDVTKAVRSMDERQRRIVYMACLLHDTGKGQGDQCIEGARLARRACRRMGMEKSEIESVAWLVRRHLDLSETAQRRDISDPDTIAEFGALVGSMSRLNMLYALTVVDVRAVGPGIWNDWKRVLLRDLYYAAAGFIEGRAGLEPAAKASAAREQLGERLPGNMAERITGITADLKDAYWLGQGMTTLVRHARFFDHAIEAGTDNAVTTHVDKKRDITELWILTRDRAGLFAELAKVISAQGAQIVGARLHTGRNRRVMNVFYLQNTDNLAFGRITPRLVEDLCALTVQVCAGEDCHVAIPSGTVSRRQAAIPITPRVDIIESAAADISIIEVEGRDRPGLLFSLADVLRDERLDVLSAHVEVVGTTAIDAFYVRPVGGGDLKKPHADKVAARLTKMLSGEALIGAA